MYCLSLRGSVGSLEPTGFWEALLFAEPTGFLEALLFFAEPIRFFRADLAAASGCCKGDVPRPGPVVVAVGIEGKGMPVSLETVSARGKISISI